MSSTGHCFLCCRREPSPNQILRQSPVKEEIKTPLAEPVLAAPPINYQSVSSDSVVLAVPTEDSAMAAADLSNLVQRLEAVTVRLEAAASRGGGAGGDASGAALAASVVAYDAQVNPELEKFVSLCQQIGGDGNALGDLVKKAFNVQRDIVVKASKCKQPAQAQMMDVFKPLSAAIEALQNLAKDKRGSPVYVHMMSVSECIPALGWVSVAPTPAPYIKEMLDAGTFYTNKVLKECKEKDEATKTLHTSWVRSLSSTIKTLQDFVKQEFTTGLTWNAKFSRSSSPRPLNGLIASHDLHGGAPPPPPPPGPPPPPAPMAAAPAASGDAPGERNALFAEINKGADITKGLKKVSDDQKTHKNPALRQGPQPFKPTISPKPGRSHVHAPSAPKAAPAKPPKTELEGKKWVVEYHNGNRNVVIEDTNMKQAVYIFKCTQSTIQIKGKVNSIILDNCKKTAVVFDGVISSLDFINCQSVQAQVTGSMRTVTIDKTDGCMVYLSKESIDAEIVTAKSSEMNILVPDDSGEFKEFAVPEQFKTVWNGQKLVTGVNDIAG
ncbi:hypothetical protein CAPTEDRAFT_18736 [Capitella teleta]|uniref:Adenylyl cyclase-associated protein n=1 Tax=Capitella teleta TaxID=283909 RepID=R7TUB5_CAPTE|nr:hypothetical protein CAPTEDRAFT_18736 [Capitella teleta]|eukprot:ELT97182.1 hypothetical protein CAPTEDRAFT_18736 [Capitella teleta]